MADSQHKLTDYTPGYLTPTCCDWRGIPVLGKCPFCKSDLTCEIRTLGEVRNA